MRAMLLCGAVLLAGPAMGQFAWNESADGEITGDRFAPLFLNAAVGSNLLSGTVVDGDIDYFTFVVPVGAELAAVNLLGYESEDFRAFLGVQAGSEFTVDPDSPSPGDLLGYVLYGPDLVGFDLLPIIGTGGGAIGFSGPLPAGQYTFWNQQTGIELTSYSFEFVIVPAPAGAAALALAGLGLGRRRG